MALTDLTRISTSGIATGSTIDSPILRKDVDFRGSQVGVTSSLFDSSDDALEFNDNVQLKFGNSGDFAIYHRGVDSVSIINETGGGYLSIGSNGNKVELYDSVNNRAMAEFFTGGACSFKHGATTRFQTTSTGAVVTGILTATSFSGGGGINAGVVTCTGLDLNGNGDVSGNFVIDGNLTVNGTTTTLDTLLTEVDRIEVGANSNTLAGIAVTQSGSADLVQLYDGTVPVVSVKGDGKIGIATASPLYRIDIGDGITDPASGYQFRINAAGDYIFALAKQSNASFSIRNNSTSVVHLNTQNSKRLALGVSTGPNSGSIEEHVTVKAGGSVGIGTNNPTSLLHLQKSSGNALLRIKNTNGASSLNLEHTNGYGAVHYVHQGTEKWRVGQTAQADHFSVYQVSGVSDGLPYRLFIQNNGEVGINTTDPANTLHLLRNANHGITLQKGGTNPGSALIQVSSFGALKLEGANNLVLQSGGSQQIIFNRGSTEVGRFNTSGLLGIGTDNPGNNLDVFKGSGNDCTVGVRVKTAGAWFEANSMTSTGYYGLKFKHGNTKRWFFGSYGSNNLQLKIGDNDVSSLMEVTSAGKIGIGNVTSPDNNVEIRTDAHGEGILIKSTGNTSNAVTFDANRGTQGVIGVVYGRWNGTTVAQMSFVSGDDGTDKNDGYITFGTESAASNGNVNADEKLRIDSDGQVQIGSGTIHGGGHLTIRGGGVNTYACQDYQYVGTPSNNTTTLAQIRFTANTTGASVVQGAKIQAVSDAAWSATGDAPTRLEFHTAPDGSASMQERLRINSSGQLIMTNSVTTTFAEFSTTNNNTRALIRLDGKNSSGTAVSLRMGGFGDTNRGEIFTQSNHSLGFATNNAATQMTLDTGGKLLIGATSATLNAKLQVSGRYVNASTSTLNLNGTGSDGPCLELFETGNTANRIALMSFNHGSLKSAIGGGRANTGNWGTDLRFYTHKESTSDQYQVYEKMRIRPDGIITFGSSGSPYQSNTVSVHPDDGMISFGMDGRTSLMSGQNSCYIFSGSGASGAIPAGSLILQSRANVNRNIFFATGSTPSLKWQIHGSTGALEEFPYNTSTSSQLTSTGNGYNLRRVRNGQVPTGNSGDTKTLFLTSDIGDAGAYIMVIRSFEQNVTGGVLWSVRMVTSPFYVHSGSGNDGESVIIPYTYSGHANNATTQASNGQGPITLRIHFYNGSAHTTGRIRLTFNGFSYSGSNCDYYLYKLIDV